jgi:hypothetical protein
MAISISRISGRRQPEVLLFIMHAIVLQKSQKNQIELTGVVKRRLRLSNISPRTAILGAIPPGSKAIESNRGQTTVFGMLESSLIGTLLSN